MTHFASTEVAFSAQTATQQVCFEHALTQVGEAGVRPDWVHLGNSSFLDNATFDSAMLDQTAIENATGAQDSLPWLRRAARRLDARAMVRTGLGLYGYVLPIEGEGRSMASGKLSPVMTWKTRIIAVSEIPEGAWIGYNGTFRARRSMRVALLPVGYADGLRRELSGTDGGRGGWVMVRGERAPIVGRISMNLTTVDVSAIAGAMAGDEVVLLGDGITAEDHARIAGTIAYEILCGTR